jgi:hypothetical protein
MNDFGEAGGGGGGAGAGSGEPQALIISAAAPNTTAFLIMLPSPLGSTGRRNGKTTPWFASGHECISADEQIRDYPKYELARSGPQTSAG